MPERGAAFLATGLLISSIWVVWVGLHSWSQQRSEDRTIGPTLVTIGAMLLGFLAAVLIPLPRPWAAVVILVGPIVGSYYTQKGAADPRRRRVVRVGLLVALLAVMAGLFVLDGADLLL